MRKRKRQQQFYRAMDENLNFFVQSILLMPMSDLEKMQKLTELFDVYHFEPSDMLDLLGSQLIGHEEIFISSREDYYGRRGNYFDICDAITGHDYYVKGDKENVIVHILLSDEELQQKRYDRMVRLLAISKEELDQKIMYKK